MVQTYPVLFKHNLRTETYFIKQGRKIIGGKYSIFGRSAPRRKRSDRIGGRLGLGEGEGEAKAGRGGMSSTNLSPRKTGGMKK